MPGKTGFRTLHQLILAAAILLIANGNLIQADEAEADKIAQAAARAQNAGEVKLALSQWEKLISQHADYSQIGLAHYQAGYCHYQLKRYAEAIEHLELAIKKSPAEQKVSLAQSYLFLGDAESKLGKQLRRDDPEASQQLLTTATQTFTTLLRKYPNFEDADQAWYFQGEAFEALKRFDEAAGSYKQVLESTDSRFKLSAQYGLGFIYEQQGKYELAHQFYNDFESAGQEQSSFNEVRFRNGEVLMQLADSAQKRGDDQEQARLLRQAAEKYAAVYEARDPRWADMARFQQANANQRMGQFLQSAQLYDSVVQISGSSLVDQARVYAGRDYYRAGKLELAQQALEKAVAVPSPFAATAASWLAKLYIQSDQTDKAFSLANQWIERTENPIELVPLMIDRANAAYENKNRKNEAAALYLEVAKKFPEHARAPFALYNAAFAELQNRHYDEAIKLTNLFESRYAQSEDLAGVLEVQGDAHLFKENAEAAEKSFVNLIKQFKDDPKLTKWRLRVGQIKYIKKDFDDAIAWLGPLTNQLQQPDELAEAWHWIGSSQYQQGKYSDAISNLQTALDTSKSWRRADETMLTLSQALYADKRFDEAKQLTAALNQQFPDSDLSPKAKYRLAEIEYESGNFGEALKNYVAVVQDHGNTSYAPYSRYGIAWSQLQLGQFEDAVAAFTDLIETHPQHELATKALIGRASSLRQNGDPKSAIKDIDRFLTSKPTAGPQEKAIYEKGLSQIALQQWPDVVSTFTDLLAIAPKSDLADRFHYELAWALRENGDRKTSLKHFEAITKNWPDSSLAAESHFHVAQAAYGAKQYDKAITEFEYCVSKCSEGSKIQEKAIYKLAWSHYKKKDFDKALTNFRKQIELFPEGSPLHADGLFMVSESLYESDQFSEALQHYRVAKPIIETSTTVSPNYRILTFLHGAQSANKAGKHEEAIQFANALVSLDGADKNSIRAAYMELGDAHRALKQNDDAIKSYEIASKHPGRTGARSMCMIGEIKFDEKKLEEAVNRFKLVLYDYGGTDATAEVRPWQAFAAYEAGRTHYVQISSSKTDDLKKFHIREARKHFQYLTENYADDQLADKTRELLANLSAVK